MTALNQAFPIILYSNRSENYEENTRLNKILWILDAIMILT